MGDENTNKQSILQQLEADLKKSELEGHKGKLKEMMKKKREAEKVVEGINREIEKYLEDNNLA